MNVEIDWTYVYPHETHLAPLEIVELLAVSSDLPDLLVTRHYLSSSDVYHFGMNGVFIPLTDLIRKYAPDIANALDATDGHVFRDRLTMPDGHIYSFPYVELCPYCEFPMMMWISSEWLASSGNEIPSDTVGLKQVLSDFKILDGNDNGRFDEIPLVGVSASTTINPLGFIMNAFVYTKIIGEAPFLYRDGALIKFAANTNEWRDGLTYLRELFDEGLLVYVEPSGVDYQTLINGNQLPETVGSFAASWNGIRYASRDKHLFYREIPIPELSSYVPVAPLQGPKGLPQATFFPPSMWYTSHITETGDKKSAEIARLVNWWFIDPVPHNFLCKDFWLEGEDWRYANAKEQADFSINAYLMGEPASGNITYDNGWNFTCFARWETEAVMPVRAAIDSDLSELLLSAATKLMAPYKVDKYMPADLVFADHDALRELGRSVAQAVLRWSNDFIFGRREIDDDADWREYSMALADAGLEEYVRTWQSSFDRRK